MQVDFNSCDPVRPLCFLSRYFDLYIHKMVTQYQYPLTYTHLQLIQNMIQRQSVSFADPTATHKLITELAISKARAEIEKENKKKPYII